MKTVSTMARTITQTTSLRMGNTALKLIVTIVLLLGGNNVRAEKGYYGNNNGNNGNINNAGDIEIHMPASQKDASARCEEITIPMCRGIGYNMTSFPNEMNHESQEEAGLEVHQYWPLVEIKCSADLKFFLCSMYTPICIEDYHKPLPVCRSVCERARAGCAPIMQQYSFSWPERMACENLPMSGDPENLCMEQPSYTEEESMSTNDNRNMNNKRKHHGSGSGSSTSNTNQKKCAKNDKKCQSLEKSKDCACKCRYPLVPLGKESIWYNTSVGKVGSVNNCGIPCRGAFFSSDEKEFAGYWIAVWSGLCAFSTLMTLTTFLIDPERFKYPERPIVFLSACYFMVSMGYLTKHFIGHDEVACDGRAIKYSSTGQSSCTIAFLLIYYFGMASSIWWVILSFTWFLSAGLKWGNEAITKHSQYFHLAAWLIPTLQSISVLVKPGVDGDPIAGICYVGNTSVENLRNFVLAPYFVYLVVGTTFLMAGFVSLFRIRSVIKQQGGIGAGSKADKLEKLMIRIGIFSVLYTVPATIVIACHLYESSFHEDWMTSLACPCVQQIELRQRPIYSVLMLKYFMTLVCGITSGIWIWSGKTLDSWRKLWRRMCGSPNDYSGAGQVLIKPRPQLPQPYIATSLGGQTAAASLLTAPYTQTIGSVASTSHHHLHHHILKHPMSHV